MRRSSLLLLPLIALTSYSGLGCGDDTAATGGGGAGAGGAGCEVAARAEDDAASPALLTPRWAFRPWISKDISDGADTYAFVAGFMERDIPVGVVVLDSPWETHYNTFVPSESRYPEFAKMVSDLKAQDVRVVLWVTQMINTSGYDLEPGGDLYEGRAPNYDQPEACGWFVNDGAIYPWWKGSGSAIDFFDPLARRFWHRLQDPLYDMGIAGFKLDFGESYISDAVIKTDAGDKTLQEYSEAYYRDFHAYGAARVGSEEMVTMVRPYDKSYAFEGRFFARPENAPVAWVGDNRRDYVGMIDALDHIFRSAEAGYVVIGSDLGGYLDRDDQDLSQLVPADAATFMRWTALAAMTPFMQLHGRANLTPWTYPQSTDLVLENYRYWAKLHDAMVPFLYSVAREAQTGGSLRMVAPLGSENEWAGDWRYMLGDAFLVAPVTDGSGLRDVAIPGDASYYDLFAPGADAIAAGTVLSGVDVSDPMRIPLYFREGAIVPLDVVDGSFGLGTTGSKGFITLVVFPGPSVSSFAWHSESGIVDLGAQRIGNAVTLSASTLPQGALWRVRLEAAPNQVLAGGSLSAAASRAALDAANEGYWYDAIEKSLWIKLQASATAVALEIN